MLIAFVIFIIVFFLIAIYASVKAAGEADEIAEQAYRMWRGEDRDEL